MSVATNTQIQACHHSYGISEGDVVVFPIATSCVPLFCYEPNLGEGVSERKREKKTLSIGQRLHKSSFARLSTTKSAAAAVVVVVAQHKGATVYLHRTHSQQTKHSNEGNVLTGLSLLTSTYLALLRLVGLSKCHPSPVAHRQRLHCFSARNDSVRSVLPLRIILRVLSCMCSSCRAVAISAARSLALM